MNHLHIAARLAQGFLAATIVIAIVMAIDLALQIGQLTGGHYVS
jgi:hypothetical protein